MCLSISRESLFVAGMFNSYLCVNRYLVTVATALLTLSEMDVPELTHLALLMASNSFADRLLLSLRRLVCIYSLSILYMGVR